MANSPIMMMFSQRLHAGARAMLALLALAAFAAAPAAPAAASTSAVTFALTPAGAGSLIRLYATPGQVRHGAVLVRNLSGHAVTVILQRADIQTGANGNANYITARVVAAGSWLGLSVGRVRLAPHASRRVPVTISIPAGAGGGSHYAGIVAIDAADLSTPATRGRSKGRAFTFYRISRQALPLTVRLPGRLSRGLSLRSATVSVQPIGAGLVLGLLPSGTELTQDAPVKLRVLRGSRTVLSYAATLGQLFPGSALNFRIPWHGTPTTGAYRVIGTIRPQGSAVININQTIQFSAHGAAQLKRVTAPGPQPPAAGTSDWMWIALAFAAALLIALSLAVWKLTRRLRGALA